MAEPLSRTSVDGVTRLTDHMERPALDTRSYRVIRLANDLEALLIHDADTDKASASLDVNIGSFSDPKDMPGLAHAVEHMLFMGTEKYPVENAYNQYLTSHNGYSNAYTSFCSTNYYFEISTSSSPSNSETPSADNPSTESPLYEALDRFSQFFIHPLFLEDTLDRELRSVDSEHKKNLQSDSWRLHQLQQTLSNPAHPFCHFSTGNWETLHDAPLARGVDLRKEFMNFYETNYSANRMKLVVLGRESLDVLEKWVLEMFSEVKNKNLPRNRWDGIDLYTEKERGTQIFVKPVIDSRSVELYFSYPDEETQFESQPGRYLSHLIGHEGPGSILVYLKEKGWANELSSGPQALCPGTANFNIHIRLTEEGLVQYQEVVKVVFQYIALLNEEPPHEWVFQELKNMSEVDFRFRQNISPSKTASTLSSVMQSPYPRHRLLSALSTLKTFDADGIRKGLSYLRPANCRFVIASKFFPGDWDQKEKWYGTEYKYEKIPKEFEEILNQAMTSSERPEKIHLPHPNEFIPTRLEVEKKEVAEPAKYPKLIRNDSTARTWFKKDDQFWVPKASVTVCMRSPLVYITPRCFITGQLYTALVQDSLNEYSYDADIAGLEYSLSNDSLGLDIGLYGYNDKMSVLLEKVLVSMRDLEVKEDRFNITKERLVRAIKNWHLKQPYQQVGHYRGWLCSDKTWLNEECYAEVETITPEDVRLFYPQILKQLHFEIVAHGNLHKEDVLRFTDVMESILKPKPLPQSLWPSRRSLIIPEGSNYIYQRNLADPDNINHCIEYVLFAGSCHDRALRSTALLAAQIADEPCYDQLRTKEQLGYVVWSSPIMTLNRVGFRILVQSEKTPMYLESRIEAFLVKFGGHLEEMDDAKFEKYKLSLVNKLREKPKNLREEMQRIYGYIANETFDFDQVDIDVPVIEQLTMADVIEFFKTYLSPASLRRAKLSVHMVAAKTVAAEPTGDSEKRDKLREALLPVLVSKGIAIDDAQLKSVLEKVEVSAPQTEPAVQTESSWLDRAIMKSIDGIEELMDPMRSARALSQGTRSGSADEMRRALREATPVIAKVWQGVFGTREGINEGVASGISPVWIEDGHAFRSKLEATCSVQPVRSVTDFEDTEPKL